MALIVNDDVTRKMEPKMREIADRLRRAAEDGEQAILRFHNDADGISGAFALTKILKCRTYAQNSAVYTPRDSLRDISQLQYGRRLVILLDFGMNQESREGVELLKAAGAELIMIDHHTPDLDSDAPVIRLNPWDFEGEGDLSRYTAGYLACEIARMLDANVERYARSACAGDKSTIMELSKEDEKKALVLDYLAINAGFGNSLELYSRISSNNELTSSIYLQAKEKLEEAVDNAFSGSKRKDVGGVAVYRLDLERIARVGDFPNRGKITTGVMDKIGKKEPSVVMACSKRTVILRANDKAVEQTIDLSSIANKLKSIMGDFVLGGGGHRKAAAVSVKEGYSKSVANQITDLISRVRAGE